MNIKDYKILYMGTPKISANCLEKLIQNGFNIVGVIAQEDKEVGRKKILEPVPTKIIANKYNIKVYQPKKIRFEYDFVKEINPDLILTFAYGQIIPHGLLEIPKFGCLNLHGSLLPKYRGAAPIQRAIMNGEKETGITLMEMTDEMDAGKMYAKQIVSINDEDNYTSLCNKLSDAAFKICNEKLLDYFMGKLIGEIQNNADVTFANKIKDEDEKIDLNLNVKDAFNYIRALSFEPSSYLILNGEKVKILEAKVHNYSTEHEVGSIVNDNKHICVQFKDGLLELIKIKPSGKNLMSMLDYYNGHKDIVNLKFN